MGTYDLGMVCHNGHWVNSRADSVQERNQEFCSKCGEATIVQCVSCDERIHGHYRVPGVIDMTRMGRPPAHCHGCGVPYPWTERAQEGMVELIAELDGLTDDDRENLLKSLPDIIADTPKTEVAAMRIKKVVARLGSEASSVLLHGLRRIASGGMLELLGL